jgi:3-hydroxyisobutyrate dehydrogenase-like beta-hydroxyacid dehydrogenase
LKIGFIGLGQMGREMAARLLDAGHALTVFNRSRAVAEPFRAKGARVAEEPGEALDNEIVVTMLADDTAVEAVWIAPGLVARMRAQCVHLNMSTVSLDMGKRLSALHKTAGSGYVSAPVFGRPHAAAQGQLDIVAAGPAGALARCEPLFKVLGKQWFTVGVEAWQANIVKSSG